MEIEIQAKDVYGKRLWYIKDPELAKHYKALTGKTTIGKAEAVALEAFMVYFKRAENEIMFTS